MNEREVTAAVIVRPKQVEGEQRREEVKRPDIDGLKDVMGERLSDDLSDGLVHHEGDELLRPTVDGQGDELMDPMKGGLELAELAAAMSGLADPLLGKRGNEEGDDDGGGGGDDDDDDEIIYEEGGGPSFDPVIRLRGAHHRERTLPSLGRIFGAIYGVSQAVRLLEPPPPPEDRLPFEDEE